MLAKFVKFHKNFALWHLQEPQSRKFAHYEFMSFCQFHVLQKKWSTDSFVSDDPRVQEPTQNEGELLKNITEFLMR